MYHVIGLKRDGRMVLFKIYHDQPTLKQLQEEIEGFDYTQLLVIYSAENGWGSQVARFEVREPTPVPPLRQVELA